MKRGNTFFLIKNERQKMRKADYSFSIYMVFKAFVFFVASMLFYGSEQSAGLLMMSAVALALTPLVALAESKITYNR
jgi:hypothetical protein